MFLGKYGAARHIYIPIVKRAVVDFAVSADWTPSAGDVKISKDGGAAANVTNLPTAITMGNAAIWDFSLTATEMQAAQVVVTIADSATKAVEDQSFIIETYGNASAQHAVDLSDSVRAGLTALPNATVSGVGGLLTAPTTANVGLADLSRILGTALTETAGQIAAAFKKFFDKGSPTGTINSIPDAVAGAAGGLFIAGTNAATTITTALTTTFTGNLTGSVASVTGAVGSVTGNVGGNVTGSVGSLATQAKADVNAEVVDALATDTYAEPGQGAPAATTSLAAKINYMFKAWRNKTTQTSTTLSLFADDAATVDQKATVSDDSTTFTRGEVASGP